MLLDAGAAVHGDAQGEQVRARGRGGEEERGGERQAGRRAGGRAGGRVGRGREAETATETATERDERST
jgi:hypothetical protein